MAEPSRQEPGTREACRAAPREARADWLSLLPIGPGARALDLGSEGGGLTLGLAGFCEQVIAVEPDPLLARATGERAARAGAANVQVVCGGIEQLPPRAGAFDVVLCRRPERLFAAHGPPGAARVLWGLVSPQGCVALAVGAAGLTARRGRFRLAAVAHALQDAGFREVVVLAALPNPLAPACVFPLGEPLPARAALRHQPPGRAGGRGTLRAAALRVVAAVAGPLPRALLPGFWVVARAPANFRCAVVEELTRCIAVQPLPPEPERTGRTDRVRSALRNRPLAFSLLAGTPEQGARVTYFAFPQGWCEPACVLHLGRQEGEAARAAEALRRLRNRVGPELRVALPLPLGTASARGQEALAEGYLEGTTLRQRVLLARRAHLPALAETALFPAAAWLADLNRQTAPRLLLRGTECQRTLRQRLRETAAAGTVLPAPFSAVLQQIAAAGTRLGATHNRLSPRNLLLRPTGIALCDWSDLAFEDLPLVDLFDLITSLGELILQRQGGRAWGLTVNTADPDAARRLAAFRFAFTEESWYARLAATAVRRYCERAALPLESARHYLPLAYLRRAWRAGREDPEGEPAAASFRLAALALEWEPDW